MTTTVVKVIGTGGDYSTLQAWEDACPPDLTSVDQIWQGQCKNQTFSTASGVLLTISGTVTDATRYLELTTQAGASFRDNASVQTNALRYNASNGAAVSSSATYAYLVSNSCEYTRISNLQFASTASNGRGVDMRTGAVTNTTVDDCIIEGAFSSATSYAPLRMYGSGMMVRNSVIVQRGSGQPNIAMIANGAQAINCTFVAPSDVATKPTNAITGSYAAPTFKNCAFFGSNTANAVTAGGTAPTYTTCYTDAATATGLAAATYANCFQNTADATRDFRLKSGSPLIDVGTTDSTNAATDIAGTSRTSGAYDVGAWEYVAASGVTVSITGLRTTSAQGSLKGATTVAVSGLRATFAQGTVTPGIAGDVTVSVTGLRATFASGVVDTVHLVAPTGIAITSAQGALTPNSTVAIAGFGMTSAQGTVTPQAPGDVTVAIGGLAMTATAGFVTGGTTVALTGVVVDMRAGTLTASGGDSHWLPVPRAHTVWTEG